jgi:hypothetical protein
MMDFPKASPMKSNFSRKVFTQNSKLAEVIILLYFQMANYSNLSYSSVSALPEIWRAFIDYLRNESIADEIGNLFISRFSQVNKNKKLITKAKDNQAIHLSIYIL